MLPRPRRLAGPLALAGALGALFSAGVARAQVTVVPTVTPNGALFNYSYTVTNSNAVDLAVVNINGLPQAASAATDLMAPTGFQISFDPGNSNSAFGIVSFLGDFTPGSVISGFSFNSAFAPGAASFDTVDNNGGTSTGTTLAPVVPEANTLVSLGAGVLLLTFCAVRRRRVARSDVRS